MINKKILVLCMIFLGLALTGYQCSSSELTSAKLYINQKNYDKAIESLQKEIEKKSTKL